MTNNTTSPLAADSPLAGLFATIVGTAAVVTATAGATPVLDFTALGVTLLPYQQEGVEYALAKRRVYLGDEMGLGKTFQAIASVLLDGTFPVLVVCPPSLTLNWRKEIAKISPTTKVEILSGTKPYLPGPADIYVIGDSVLAKWVGIEKAGKYEYKVTGTVLPTLGLQALVIDEAHRFKTPSALRTIAAEKVADMLPANAMRILMSGTAIVNRHAELAPQVKIAGVANVFGGIGAFYNRFAPKIDRFGTRGSTNGAELHALMTGAFYLRRLRNDVLTLPGKGRQTVATEMTGKAARDYLRAQQDLIAYVRAERGDKAANKAAQAEALVMLNTLRQLVGRAKIQSVVAYVTDLVEEGEQVFVAAWHADVVKGICEGLAKYDVVTITGQDTTAQKQASVEAFQAGQANVLVGNIVAAGVGHTLTAARHIVVAELPWTPGDLQQVEDRLDRIGQTRNVLSHIMLGANGIPTVDERLMAILNDKAGVTGMALDGKAASIVDDESIASALLNSYKEG